MIIKLIHISGKWTKSTIFVLTQQFSERSWNHLIYKWRVSWLWEDFGCFKNSTFQGNLFCFLNFLYLSENYEFWTILKFYFCCESFTLFSGAVFFYSYTTLPISINWIIKIFMIHFWKDLPVWEAYEIFFF